MRIPALIPAFLIALMPWSLFAQTTSSGQVGTPTRLLDSIPAVVGALAQNGNGPSRSERRFGARKKGAVIGLVAGGVTGGVLAWEALGKECQCADPVVLLGGLSAGLGAAIGVFTGGLVDGVRHDRSMAEPRPMAFRGSGRIRRVSFSWRF